MERVVRAFPITSRDDLLEMAAEVEKFSADDKKIFFDNFNQASEDWYYQEIAGQPHVIGVVTGDNLEQAFANYAQLDDPFSLWFKNKVTELTKVNLNETPKGPEAEHVFCFNGGC